MQRENCIAYYWQHLSFLDYIILENMKKLLCNSTVKIWFGGKKVLNYAYMLKNGVCRYNIFLKCLHKACWILLFVSFSCRIRQCFCLCHVLFLQQTILRKRFTEWVHCVGCMNVTQINIGVLTEWKKIKQRHISFVPG